MLPLGITDDPDTVAFVVRDPTTQTNTTISFPNALISNPAVASTSSAKTYKPPERDALVRPSTRTPILLRDDPQRLGAPGSRRRQADIRIRHVKAVLGP